MRKAKLGKCWVLAGALILFNTCAYAASSSTNYSLADDSFGGGQGSSQSASYMLERSSFGSFSGTSSSSANYRSDAGLAAFGAQKIPSIQSITPTDYSRFYSDQSASFTVQAVTPDGDTLQYRAKQSGTTKAGPQTSSTLAWTLSSADLGRRALSFEVIDPDGTVLRNASTYVYRRPVK